MFKKLVSLLLFVLATSAFAQSSSPYGRILTLDPSGTQQWIDIIDVLNNYQNYHPSPSPISAWLTNGNLLSGGEFLGSTNNQPLNFKTNNTEQMRITPTGQIGIGTNSPDPSAILEIVSNTTGILIPRLTTSQRNAIGSPATGLLIYNTITNSFDYYDGTSWQTIITATSTVPFNLIASGTNTSANMVVGAGATFTTNDDAFTIQDDADNTKKAKFEASSITAGTARTYNLPNGNGTLALLDISQTFLGTQTFNDISVTGNTTLGNANSDALTVNATSTFNAPITGASATFNNNLTVNDNTTLGNAPADALTVNATSTFNAPITGTSATFNNNLTVNGNTTLGDATTDVITIKGKLNDGSSNGILNQVLAVGGDGTPAWTTLSTLEDDPQVGPFTTTGQVAVWDQTNGYLAPGSITDNGTTVSVGSNFSVTVASGNTTTNGNLTVNGNTTLGNANSDALTINATSTFAAAVNFPVTTVTGNTTLDNSHFLVLVNATFVDVTIILPDATTCTGRMYVIMRIDNSLNDVIISPSGGQTINGVASIVFATQWRKYTVMSDGSNWVAWQ